MIRCGFKKEVNEGLVNVTMASNALAEGGKKCVILFLNSLKQSYDWHCFYFLDFLHFPIHQMEQCISTRIIGKRKDNGFIFGVFCPLNLSDLFLNVVCCTFVNLNRNVKRPFSTEFVYTCFCLILFNFLCFVQFCFVLFGFYFFILTIVSTSKLHKI